MKTLALIILLFVTPAYAYTLTAEEKAVLGHVVIDPQAWADHAEKAVGADAVKAKIAKYRSQYNAAKAAEGGNYKSRAEKCQANPLC